MPKFEDYLSRKSDEQQKSLFIAEEQTRDIETQRAYSLGTDQLQERIESRVSDKTTLSERTDYYFRNHDMLHAKAIRYRALSTNVDKTDEDSRRYGNKKAPRRRQSAREAGELFEQARNAVQNFDEGGKSTIEIFQHRAQVMELRLKARHKAAEVKARSAEHEAYLKDKATYSCMTILKEQLEDLREKTNGMEVDTLLQFNKKQAELEKMIEAAKERLEKSGKSAARIWQETRDGNDALDGVRFKKVTYPLYHSTNSDMSEDAVRTLLTLQEMDKQKREQNKEWPLSIVLKTSEDNYVTEGEEEKDKINREYQNENTTPQRKEEIKRKALLKVQKYRLPSLKEMKGEKLIRHLNANLSDYYDVIKVALPHLLNPPEDSYEKQYIDQHPEFKDKLQDLKAYSDYVDILLRQEHGIIKKEENNEFETISKADKALTRTEKGKKIDITEKEMEKRLKAYKEAYAAEKSLKMGTYKLKDAENGLNSEDYQLFLIIKKGTNVYKTGNAYKKVYRALFDRLQAERQDELKIRLEELKKEYEENRKKWREEEEKRQKELLGKKNEEKDDKKDDKDDKKDDKEDKKEEKKEEEVKKEEEKEPRKFTDPDAMAPKYLRAVSVLLDNVKISGSSKTRRRNNEIINVLTKGDEQAQQKLIRSKLTGIFDAIKVPTVEQINSGWFEQTLREKPDEFLQVLRKADCLQDLFDVFPYAKELVKNNQVFNEKHMAINQLRVQFEDHMKKYHNIDPGGGDDDPVITEKLSAEKKQELGIDDKEFEENTLLEEYADSVKAAHNSIERKARLAGNREARLLREIDEQAGLIDKEEAKKEDEQEQEKKPKQKKIGKKARRRLMRGEKESARQKRRRLDDEARAKRIEENEIMIKARYAENPAMKEKLLAEREVLQGKWDRKQLFDRFNKHPEEMAEYFTKHPDVKVAYFKEYPVHMIRYFEALPAEKEILFKDNKELQAKYEEEVKKKEEEEEERLKKEKEEEERKKEEERLKKEREEEEVRKKKEKEDEEARKKEEERLRKEQEEKEKREEEERLKREEEERLQREKKEEEERKKREEAEKKKKKPENQEDGELDAETKRRQQEALKRDYELIRKKQEEEGLLIRDRKDCEKLVLEGQKMVEMALKKSGGKVLTPHAQKYDESTVEIEALDDKFENKMTPVKRGATFGSKDNLLKLGLVRQNEAYRDCYIISTIAGIVKANPAYIKDIVRDYSPDDDGNPRLEVRLYDETGVRRSIIVNRSTSLNDGRQAWLQAIEKAAVIMIGQANGSGAKFRYEGQKHSWEKETIRNNSLSYSALDEGHEELASRLLFGRKGLALKTRDDEVYDIDGNSLIENDLHKKGDIAIGMALAYVKAGKVVVASTCTNNANALKYNRETDSVKFPMDLSSKHAHTILGEGKPINGERTVKVWDPIKGKEIDVPFSVFKTCFTDVYISGVEDELEKEKNDDDEE
jgi:hypothetical protein